MPEEFEIVDENENIIGKAPRSECHKNPKFLHRSAGVFVFNSKGELLMERRSMLKDMGGGQWSISSWGHLDIGEDYEHAAKRELKEELGIDAPIRPLFKFTIRKSYESEIVQMYEAGHEGPFRPNTEEISELKFFGLGRLKSEMKKHPEEFTDACHDVMEEYFRRLK